MFATVLFIPRNRFALRFTGSAPHQVFVGKIPRDLYEDELVPLFESAGAIWDLRLMMDPLSGQNRGYAFITYCNKDDAQKAVKLVSELKVVFISRRIRISVFTCETNVDSFSVITTKSALASTWVFAYL